MRSYKESCGIAHAFDLIGERWAGLVIRELILGPKRFTDLAADLPGASPSILSDRLRQLSARGVITRRPALPPERVQLYELTPWGARLRPILSALGDWALASPSHNPGAPLSDDAAALALVCHFTGGNASWTAEHELRIGRGVFAARITRGKLAVQRGAARRPAATLTTEATRFVRLLGSSPHQAIERENLVGDAEGMRRLLGAVRFPETHP